MEQDNKYQYIENSIEQNLTSIVNCSGFKEWYEIVKPILMTEEFQKRKLMKHHDESVWDHCIAVSFKAFQYSKKFKADSRNCAIAGLMHDFYPHAWQYSKSLESLDESYSYYFQPNTKKPMLFKQHGFIHAKEARDNFKKYFSEYSNKRIENAILRHMFPLNIKPPTCKEGWIVTLADKTVTMHHMPSIKEWPKYIGLNNSKKF